MSKLTLLDLTQKILRSISGDEVNSINDTVESMDVVDIIEETYYDIVARLNLPEMYGVFQLTASLNTSKPVTMTVPSTIDTVLWIKYNKVSSGDTDPDWKDIHWMEPYEFVTHVQSFSESDSDVISYTAPDGNQLFCYNDRPPTYYTSIDDRNVVFDAYDAAVDDTLVTAKTQCYGTKMPVFTKDDEFVPDLDANMFPLLLNEAKATAFVELKQSQNANAEKKAKKHWITQQSSKQNVKGSTLFQKLPHYGRK